MKPEEFEVKMNQIEVKIDDLPELPFEKILSYLSLEDRIRSRAVSRRWYKTIDSFRVKSLFYSERPSGFIFVKGRLVSGAFAQNFISSVSFESFFNAFGQSILVNLKRLRLFDLSAGGKTFASTLNSFGRLEELSIILTKTCPPKQFKLSLPMLKSLHLERVFGIKKMTLNAPKLKKVKFTACSASLRLAIVHAESVEKLFTWKMEHVEVKSLSSLSSLQYLYIGPLQTIDSTFLSGLKELKEIHLNCHENVTELFRQKERYGRFDLKIYLNGLLLNGPTDPAIVSGHFDFFTETFFGRLAENPSRLADEIPFFNWVTFKEIQRVAPELEIELLNKITDLCQISVDEPVQNIDHFLGLLRNCSNIVVLKFSCGQPQNLFDRLPEYCAVRWLVIDRCTVSDFRFLSKLENLIRLQVGCSVNAETIRKVFELKFFLKFDFKFNNKPAKVRTDFSKRFEVSVRGNRRIAANLDRAIQFIIENTRSKRRKRKSSQPAKSIKRSKDIVNVDCKFGSES